MQGFRHPVSLRSLEHKALGIGLIFKIVKKKNSDEKTLNTVDLASTFYRYLKTLFA